MKRNVILILFCLLSGFVGNVQAQQPELQARSVMVSPSVPFFVPHWFVHVQGGGSYDLGEAQFGDLLSPSLQFSVGYHYNPWLATRLSVSGIWARNRYAYPLHKYEWNFVQPSFDAVVDLTSLLAGWQPERLIDIYAFAGLGVAYAFNNDDAVAADKYFGVDFQKLWKDYRWNPVLRGGLGARVHLTDMIALTAEVNANMLPDHFNSKRGKHDNRDWHFNGLLGLSFTLGRSHGATEPIYQQETAPLNQAPSTRAAFVDVPVDKLSFNTNIYFLINQSIIRDCEIGKLTRLISYLNEHPRAFIRLSGYADKETGNPTINMRLSRERAQVVSNYLISAGIEEWRIRRFAKGDTVQPFDIPEDNRVCICFVYDPDDPKYATDYNQ